MPPQRIIVRCPNWIGDQVMALGFHRNLRRAYPSAHITWLVRKSLAGLTLLGLADETIVLPEDARRWGLGFWNFAQALREMKFDLSVSLPATLKASLLFFLSRIPERTGFSADGNALFYTSYLKWKGRASKRHKANLYLELFEFLTSRRASFETVTTHLEVRDPSIVIAPGASIPLREWPYFEQLLDQLLERSADTKIYIVGSQESHAWHEKLKRRNSERVVDLIEKTSLDELVDVCRRASLVIANDSGVAHVAGTLAGAKTLVLFGPGDPDYIAPHGNVTAVRRSLSCSPCEKPYCRSSHGYQACLKMLSVDTVLKHLAIPLH